MDFYLTGRREDRGILKLEPNELCLTTEILISISFLNLWMSIWAVSFPPAFSDFSKVYKCC
jgi:hypothetical protein